MAELKTVVKPIACGGTGGDPVVVESQDGKIVRIRPLHWDMSYSAEELAPSMWELNVRGVKAKMPMKAFPPYYALAYKKKTYSKDRVKYPLKRVDWDPYGERNPQNRGISSYERISWDEAIDLIEYELRRVYRDYGPSAILAIGENGHKESKSIHYGGGCHMALLRHLGGYTREVRTPDSVEGFYWGGKHVWGTGVYDGLGMQDNNTNVMKDFSEHGNFLVMQAGDLETTQNYSSQFWSFMMKYWLELGIDMVTIDPFGTYTTMVHDEIAWIPILPNTDAALDFALIHLWLTEDLYDKEYVETHTVGIEKMIDYVMGKEDGIVKDAAWASELCGVPEWTIKALARKWAEGNTSIGHFCGAHIRGPYSFEPGRTEYYKLAMQGIGRPGVHQIGLFSWTVAEQIVPPLGGNMSYQAGGHAELYAPNDFTIPRTAIHHAIFNGKFEWYGSPSIIYAPAADQFVKRVWPNTEAGAADSFRLLWSEKASNQASWNGGFYLQEAYRQPTVECFIMNHQWMQCDTIFADIVLPVTSCLEDFDMSCSAQGGSVHMYGIQEPASDVVGESKSDYEIGALIAKRFGDDIYDKFTKGLTLEEEKHAIFDTSLIQNFISYDDLAAKKYYVPPMKPGWEDEPAGMYNFYKDPENNPVATPTGKIQFYAPELDEHFPDDVERGAMARWNIGGSKEDGFTHDESLWGEKAKTYPLLLNTSPGRWRVHVQNDDITWLREIPTCKIVVDGYAYEPVWMCPELAAERGIAEGDIVKVFNNEGIVLGAAKISERVLPNSVKMDKGAHPDPIGPRIDRGGCTNLISPPDPISKNCVGFVVTGYLVDVAKVEASEWEQWKKDYPGHFERAKGYHLPSGSCIDGWVEGGLE